MLGLFIVVTDVEQRLIVLPNTAGKRSFMAPTLVFISVNLHFIFVIIVLINLNLITLHRFSGHKYLLMFFMDKRIRPLSNICGPNYLKLNGTLT